MLQGVTHIRVPTAFLRDTSLHYGTRIVGMAIQLGLELSVDQEKLLSPTFLAKQLGKKKVKTISNALQELQASRWPVDKPFITEGVPCIEVSNVLILDKKLTNCAKLLFCFILSLPVADDGLRVARISELRKWFGLGINTIKRGLVALRTGLWLTSLREHKLTPLRIKVGFPLQKLLASFHALVDLEDQGEQLEGTSHGERLLLGALNVLVDSDYYDDHYSPKFLINPDTNCPMHHDRIYHDEGVAIEFNGPQHYYATDLYDAEVVAEQKQRDHNKRGVCKHHNKKLLEFTVEDLTVEKIVKKVEGHLPLRELPRTILDFIDNRLKSYVGRCSWIKKPEQAKDAAVA